MKIVRLRITVEPLTLNRLNFLSIQVLRYPGGELNFQKAIPDDDLHSLWDHLWEEAGKELRSAMEADN